jgi:urea transport system permease protein
MIRMLKAGAIILVALIGFLAAREQARADEDRSAILGSLCGPGLHAPMQGAGQIMAGLPTASSADLNWAEAVVQAFSLRTLRCAPAGTGYIATPAGMVDAVTLKPAPTAPDDLRSPFPNLRMRVLLDRLTAAIAVLNAPHPEARLAAVSTLAEHSDLIPPGLAEAALKRTQNASVAAALRGLIVLQRLQSPDVSQRVAAIQTLSQDTTSRTENQLESLRADPAYAADPQVAAALDQGIAHVRFWVRAGAVLSLLYNGISAGSVLFMSAIGLSIIFGLMGVINLAQGELLMIGAYVTYTVQQVIRIIAPAYLSLYPIAAIPVVFIVTALLGIVIEWTVIRHLYRRPLMTLLATWGISLLLINLVRVSFGTQNLEFITPPYLTGGVAVVGDFFITWNHLAAIFFAVAAFIGTLALLRLTSIGLFIRGVTQNRDMAGCIGISTRRIDMLAFGLGAGLAGLGGLALSPIYNVNPTMGTEFIIDSFMVVVLGGVGSLIGTAIAALGIGLVNVGIEPFYGAVAAKVIALLLIIVLIQWRPEGLIAARGRR